MNTISIQELVALSKEGRVALRQSAEFGQTGAGAHCAVSAERRIVIDLSPDGEGSAKGTLLVLFPARGAGEGNVFFDPETGLVWWGSTETLRVLRDSAEPLEGGTVIKDAANAAYQRALLSGAV